MGAVSTKQCLIMGTMMTMNNGEFCLVEVSDSKDVETVKSIFQSRIDYMGRRRRLVPRPHGYVDQQQPGGFQRQLCHDGRP